MIKHIVVGLILVISSGCVMYFSNTLAGIFGYSPWAHKYFGGTRNAILVIGFIFMVLGFLITFGIFQPSVEQTSSLQLKIDQ